MKNLDWHGQNPVVKIEIPEKWPWREFEEAWNLLTVEINHVGIPRATEILRAANEATYPKEIPQGLASESGGEYYPPYEGGDVTLEKLISTFAETLRKPLRFRQPKEKDDEVSNAG
jgi:hypothetical protein